MIYHDLTQQSEEWFRARLGVATASCFDKIITPKTGELSKSAEAYANALIGEMVTGESAEKFESYWMERGAEMEGAARNQYELITDFTLDRGGFTTDDDMVIGASPDLRVRKNGTVVGGAEIKCPAAATHVANLLRTEIDPQYIPQVQGQILVCGFEFVDWFSYHPDFPPALIRVHRDEAYCDKLEKALEEFIRMMDQKIATLRQKNVIIPPRPIVELHRTMNDTTMKPSNLMAG